MSDEMGKLVIIPLRGTGAQASEPGRLILTRIKDAFGRLFFLRLSMLILTY